MKRLLRYFFGTVRQDSATLTKPSQESEKTSTNLSTTAVEESSPKNTEPPIPIENEMNSFSDSKANLSPESLKQEQGTNDKLELKTKNENQINSVSEEGGDISKVDFESPVEQGDCEVAKTQIEKVYFEPRDPVFPGHVKSNLPEEAAVYTAGNKRALIVVSTYQNADNNLPGTINDGLLIYSKLVSKFKYREEDIVLLTDAECDKKVTAKPTKVQIISALRENLKKLEKNDILFWYYSGHGIERTAENGDEEDGIDECMVTLDGQFIYDNEISKIIDEDLPAGATLFALFDCCNSGTIFDLPYANQKNGELKIFKNYLKNNENPQSESLSTEPVRRVIAITSCQDSAPSYEGKIEDENIDGGFVTGAFVKTIDLISENLSHGQLIEKIRKNMPKILYQMPALSVLNREDLDGPFML